MVHASSCHWGEEGRHSNSEDVGNCSWRGEEGRNGHSEDVGNCSWHGIVLYLQPVLNPKSYDGSWHGRSERDLSDGA